MSGRYRLLRAFGLAMTCCAAVRVSSQTSRQAAVSFDAASVKLNTSGAGPRFIRTPAGGLFSAINVPLADLIFFAYGIPNLEFRAVGMPSWASTTHYDVTAHMDASHVRTDGSFAMDDMRAMLRTLLEQRFTLVSRVERRDVPIYALVKTRDGGALGARLHPSGATCPPIVLPAGIPMPPPPPSPPPGTSQDAAAPFDFNCAGLALPGHIFARRISMGRFADMLQIFVRRVVVDRTGLEGTFDADLDYYPDPAIAQQGVFRHQPGAPPPPGIDPNAPELFTAIQEQLGLKLESARGSADIVVIESVQHPTDD